MKKVFCLLPLAAFALAEVETRDGGGVTPPSGIMHLYRQVNSLQEEVQALRGMLEEQNYQLQQLQAGSKVVVSNPTVNNETQVEKSSESDIYNDAMKALEIRDYDHAFLKFNDLSSSFPTGKFAANALYWAAEISMLQGKPQEAKKRFAVVLEEYSKHPKAADSLLKLGFIAEKEGRVAEAKALFIDVTNRYPQTASARLAEARLARLS